MKMEPFPFDVEDFTQEEDPRPKVRVQPGGFVIYPRFRAIAQRIYNIKFRPGDIVLITTPKSGTHWTLEMIWNISHNVDIETAKKVLYWHRAAMLESEVLDWDLLEELREKKAAGGTLMEIEESVCNYNALDTFDNLPSPRVCFTHLPINLLPPNTLDVCKVIFLTRNPADVVCSYHPFMRARLDLQLDFDTFFRLFIQGDLLFTPYWTSVKEIWKRKSHPNLFFLRYEKMKKDLRTCINQVAAHIDKQLTEEQVDLLLDHLSFDNMKNNPAINLSVLQGSALMESGGQICRKGQVGDFKNVLTEEQKNQLKEWINKNRGDCDIVFEEMNL